MSAHERLHAAHRASLEGRHEFALQEFLWFHDHALAEEAALYGVRLSFALSYWVELGQSYPPALQALRQVRDSKTATIAAGAGTRDLFHDVESINEALGESSATSELFAQLDIHQPALAMRCAALALQALVASGDFSRAAKYMPDPEPHVHALSRTFLEDMARIAERPRSKAPRYKAFIHIFSGEISLLCAVLRGTGKSADAERLHDLALSLVKPPHVRKAVAAHLAR